MRDLIALINLDSSACRAMARTLRAGRIYCKILSADVAAEAIFTPETQGIILAGGNKGQISALPSLPALLEGDLPLLAMGDAALSLCEALGGCVNSADDPGVVSVRYENDPLLFEGVEEEDERYQPLLRTMDLGRMDAQPTACTAQGVLGFRLTERPVYALGLNLERHDLCGTQILKNFAFNICGCTPWWDNRAFIDQATVAISHAAGDGTALCAISGGVDSGVCAMLGHMALGQRMHCIFVDNGLLRADEAERVLAFYRDQMGLNVRCINARQEFLTALEGIVLPADKEAVIRRLMRDILNREAAALPNMRLLIRGTNFSDTQKPDDFPLTLPHAQAQLIAPVRELFKDEIRRVGQDLGIPAEMTQRQPFPGSGLALRILADITPERLSILRTADAIFREEIDESGQNKRLWQYFAALALGPYYPADGYVITLRAVQAIDGAAAMPARLPSDLLERASQRIREALPQVIRVMYDLTPSSSYAATELN